MVKKGDTWKDLQTYITCRTEHLQLEMNEVIHNTKQQHREKALKKLKAKIEELHHLKKVVNEDIKAHSKYEWKKVQHLKKKKALMSRIFLEGNVVTKFEESNQIIDISECNSTKEITKYK